jgi:DeoR/GlpR family transcriptional regulator of sugar metabolism
MLRQTRGEVLVLADSSKIGVVADVAICPLDRADLVIVDDGIEDGVLEELKRLGLQVVVV